MNTAARELLELIDQYWDLAHAEGLEGRMTDTEAGDAQRCRHEIESRITTLTQQGGEQEAGALEGMCDAYHGAREDLLDWKRRAQQAEAELRRLGYTGIVPRQLPEVASDAIRSALEAALEWARPMEEAPKSSRPNWFDQARTALRSKQPAAIEGDGRALADAAMPVAFTLHNPSGQLIREWRSPHRLQYLFADEADARKALNPAHGITGLAYLYASTDREIIEWQQDEIHDLTRALERATTANTSKQAAGEAVAWEFRSLYKATGAIHCDWRKCTQGEFDRNRAGNENAELRVEYRALYTTPPRHPADGAT